MRAARFLVAALLLAPASSLAEELNKLQWLSGCWGAVGAEQGSGEQWMKPAGESMLGMSRTIEKGRTSAFEFVRIERRRDGNIYYIAQPHNQAMAKFKLIEISSAAVVFENRKHDFPQRIRYALDGDDLNAQISGAIKGKNKKVDFPMRRISCGP